MGNKDDVLPGQPATDDFGEYGELVGKSLHKTVETHAHTPAWTPGRRMPLLQKNGFGNMLTGFEFNETCMVITIVFLILFMYKEEIMRSKVVKGLLK